MKKEHKFLNFIKKYPVIISSCLLIPSLVSIVAYIFTEDFEFNYNYYYEGPKMPVEAEDFELTGIKKVASVRQLSSGFSYQGGACYENYYAVCCDNFEAIIIYDTNTMKVAHTINTGMVETTWHCNQMFFGDTFYTSSDKFPLLYVSMEHKDVRSTMVFRISKQAGTYYVNQIQQLELLFSKSEDTIYFPNSYFDYQSGLLYYGGYTKNSYMNDADNLLKYYVFDLPDYRFEHVYLDTESSYEAFTLPAETATQGGFISEGFLYQTFSFNSQTDPAKMPKMRVVDLREHKIIKEYQNLGASFGIYEEFEHVCIDNNGKMLSLGNPFNIYEFEYRK